MKECFIFFDNDGVTSSWETWRTDVSLDIPTLVNVNIYKWNTIDKFCRRLHENINVNAVCISCWKEVFDDKKNVEIFTKLANIQRIKFLSDEEFIDKIKNDDLLVLECSSFQLETIKNFRPHIAVVLNITEDHLNRHYTMENYVFLKAKLLKNLTFLVIYMHFQ